VGYAAENSDESTVGFRDQKYYDDIYSKMMMQDESLGSLVNEFFVADNNAYLHLCHQPLCPVVAPDLFSFSQFFTRYLQIYHRFW
jgi:hypothetical protein